MRKRTLGVVLLAGLAMSGAGAFTAANDMTAVQNTDKNVAGYGNATVSGGKVSSINYSQDALTQKVTGATFVAVGDWTASTSAGSIRFLDGSTTPVQLAAWTCTKAAGALDALGAILDTKFTCAPSGTGTGQDNVQPLVADVITTGITLTK